MVLFTDAAHADLRVIRRKCWTAAAAAADRPAAHHRARILGCRGVVSDAGFLHRCAARDAAGADRCRARSASGNERSGTRRDARGAQPRKRAERWNLRTSHNHPARLRDRNGNQAQHDSARGRGHYRGNRNWPPCRCCAGRRPLCRFLRIATRHHWTSEHWLHIPVVALAALCFATAQALGGSGFIACFVGGLLFGYLHDQPKEMLGGAASTGEVLAMLIWVVFGGAGAGATAGPHGMVDADLRRTQSDRDPYGAGIPIAARHRDERRHQALSLVGSAHAGLPASCSPSWSSTPTCPAKKHSCLTAACTVLLSIIAHGVTANPLIAMLRRRRVSRR